MIRNFSLSLLAAALCLLALGGADAQASHTLGYQFNETGTTALADGSAADASGNPVLNLIGNDGTATDLHGGPGSGVSGQSDDLAFDNTGNNGSLFSSTSHAENPADFDPIDTFDAFTVAGWFRLPAGSESLGRQAMLANNADIRVTGPRGGFAVTGGATADSGTLRLRVNEVSGVTSDPGTYDEVDQWVNFAITYDGNTGDVQFYKGLVDQPLSLVDTATYNQGSVQDVDVPLTLGVDNVAAFNTGFYDGLLDNFRVWDFVVDQGTLEGVRQGDARIAGVPEPASLLLAGLGLCGLGIARRRRNS